MFGSPSVRHGLYSWSSHWGLAPQLSTVYGKFDNGANVFLKYWNFAGTSLPTGWTINDGGTVTVDNGVSVYADSSASWNRGGLGYNNPIASPYVVETWMKDDPGSNDGNLAIFPFVPSDITTSSTDTTLYLVENFDGWVWQNPSGTMNKNANYKTNIDNVYALYGYAVNVSKATESVNYGSSTPVESGYTSTTYIGFASYTNTMDASWVRVRAYPPDGVMSSVTFGSLTTVSISGHQISFQQTSLPAYTKWGIRLNNTTSVIWQNSTSQYDNITGLSGSYTFQVINATGYASNPYTGVLDVSTANLTQSIVFTGYTMTFTESGLPSGETWYVNLTDQSGLSESSTGLITLHLRRDFHTLFWLFPTHLLPIPPILVSIIE